VAVSWPVLAADLVAVRVAILVAVTRGSRGIIRDGNHGGTLAALAAVLVAVLIATHVVAPCDSSFGSLHGDTRLSDCFADVTGTESRLLKPDNNSRHPKATDVMNRK
jgi:hypothetical protein